MLLFVLRDRKDLEYVSSVMTDTSGRVIGVQITDPDLQRARTFSLPDLLRFAENRMEAQNFSTIDGHEVLQVEHVQRIALQEVGR